MAQMPETINPPDGNCTPDQNGFSYTLVGAGVSYTLSYCLGGPTGSVVSGPHCATPAGVADGTGCAPSGGGSCTPNCAGKVCGDDGCGGSCGTCSGNDVCNNGICETIGDSFSCPGTPVVQYEGGPYDATGLINNQGGYYRTVQIGTQCFLRDNLNVGTRIDGANNQGDYSTEIQKYCYYDDPEICDIYGGLYQWHMATGKNQSCSNFDCSSNPTDSCCPESIRGICPNGWHIPSNDEWFDLSNYLVDDVGGKLKEAGTAHWIWENCGNTACNISGFFGLPSGNRWTDGSFEDLGYYGYLWTSSPHSNSSIAWRRHFRGLDSGFYDYPSSRTEGHPVRCLKD